jgi:hypothetical protein
MNRPPIVEPLAPVHIERALMKKLPFKDFF